MSTLDEDIERGNRARQIIDDPLFVEAKKHIEGELWRLFCSAVPTDHESLANIKAMQYMHAKYIAFLNNAIQNGKLAELEVKERKKTVRDRIRERLA